jgi:hypothetical protein
VDEPDPYEPNDDADSAAFLASGDSVRAYISWPEDVDVFYITTTSRQPIVITLQGIPAGTDYDLYLLDESEVVALSESETPQELIEYVPLIAGTYWVAVASYSGSSTSAPYTLSATYDGGGAGGGGVAGITLTGTAVDASTGRPLSGGVFGLLQPGATCSQLFSAPNLDLSLVLVSDETNLKGFFELNGVPTGVNYTAFFAYGGDTICEDAWLEVPAGSVDSDIGAIEMSF